ncbi:hypothetical protein EYZ11_010905 [Aspergillus tanneri]|uniref:Uncharacterized protein n=1 Tax=Aspergillus tanneri TaxID=1220188 RepID=A0A4S3J4R6_9EURO|nr:hypothetical protein EYZ11_010905 [Aspergillus tanneri]
MQLNSLRQKESHRRDHNPGREFSRDLLLGQYPCTIGKSRKDDEAVTMSGAVEVKSKIRLRSIGHHGDQVNDCCFQMCIPSVADTFHRLDQQQQRYAHLMTKSDTGRISYLRGVGGV